MSGFHEVGRNLEIKQKIESAVVKTIESVPEKSSQTRTYRNAKPEMGRADLPGHGCVISEKRICTGWKIKGRRLPEI